MIRLPIDVTIDVAKFLKSPDLVVYNSLLRFGDAPLSSQVTRFWDDYFPANVHIKESAASIVIRFSTDSQHLTLRFNGEEILFV